MVRFILRVNFYVGHLARISYCTIVKNLQQGLKYHNFQLLSSKIRIWGDFVRKWIKKELSTIFMIDWTNGMSKNARYNKKSSMSFLLIYWPLCIVTENWIRVFWHQKRQVCPDFSSYSRWSKRNFHAKKCPS